VRILPLVALCGCITSVLPPSHDFSDESPDEALSSTIDALDESYAFTDWKDLDWEAVYERLAEEDDWDRTVRLLVEAIPDGHVILENEDGRLCPEAAGSTGVLFSDTDEGDIIVVDSDVDEVEPGDVLVSWNGLDVDAALDAQPLFCFPVGLATNERRRNGRIRLLGRGEVGATSTATLDRDGSPVEVTLDVKEDGDDLREMLGLEAADERVSSRMLTNDVGYLAIGWEATAVTDAEVRSAVRQLWRDGARKLVVDLRDNDGGTDQTAANVAGVFTDREWFYETITMYDRRTGEQDVISEVWVEEQEVQWTLPVAALINGNTVSSGEGIAMMLARFDGVEVVGFEGTAASFGSTGSTAKLPDGWELTWPAGRSLDAEGVIQLDSDHTLEGGVSPTHRIPWTAANRIAWAEDPEGFEIDYAVDLLADR
jgi:carboxyl-terminal processing protease